MSKTELPLLQLLENLRLKGIKIIRISLIYCCYYYHLVDALPHLQECLTHSDYPFADTVKFDEFIDNMDYSIVTRYDIKLDEELVASEKRRHQYLNRIKEVIYSIPIIIF